MCASRLRLNQAKTSYVAGLSSAAQAGGHQHSSLVERRLKSACNLGVTIDSQLSLSAHVAALCRCVYFQLRQLRPAVNSLTTEAA